MNTQDLTREVFTIVHPYLSPFAAGDPSGLTKELVAHINQTIANQVAEALDKQAVRHAAELSTLDQEIMSLKATLKGGKK